MEFIEDSSILAITDDFPIRTDQPIHKGKVRSVYWLNRKDSQRLIKQKKYKVPLNTPLAIMIISDRISAFDCVWYGKNNIKGVPGKGASLNAISNYWFKLFKKNNLADNHILDIPHPLVWVVRKAKPIMIEGICRRFITGSMWRSYKDGKRKFCGLTLPEDLKENMELPKLLVTPSTKGIIKGVPGIPEIDDIHITRENIEENFSVFNFLKMEDISQYEKLLKEGFSLISNRLANVKLTLVDTKFEFGYVTDVYGKQKLLYIDEVGTPDSSRIWDTQAYQMGNTVENSKEKFRQLLLNYFVDYDILLNKERVLERKQLALNSELPVYFFQKMSKTYVDVAEIITGSRIALAQKPRKEIIQILKNEYNIID
ncbi:phosphoribosylaminoimidazole-succinocarboxamide synthase [Candidatus Photodesmus blepharus]|uniref:Phosphoribosylaminoimidazole-succinocarboxamide synthase n=1 Tax=Candidatus Photodesmus blepharonis TaxID=1179155 RepID=A0A084CMY2_9GAMM|nr:phosphoribosylaminoimidazolesuccinocarboxamide synthase [Candidatus Photodesmus blepharus]KEY91161.1 phosphoribosylaminoimidazole-succinocarboxamide synthase [Candidatus Photodesmus blepharus]